MSAFEPVFLPPDRLLRRRASQTFLRHANACLRSGYLYALHRGEARTDNMERGGAVHRVIELAIRTMIEQEEPRIPQEVVKDIVNEVLADPRFAVPVEEHDYIRECAWRWAEGTVIEPAAVVACETLFVLDVAGWQVRAKIDFAQLLEGGAAILVRDWKSARGMPSFGDVSRKRPDGTLMARNFQLVLYALALAFGRPVREEPCQACSGKGFVVQGGQSMSARVPCRECGGFSPQLDVAVPRDREGLEARMGRGVVEVVEPFAVAERVQRFDLEFVYPGIDVDGEMATRPVSLTRLELTEYRASLEGLLHRVEAAEETGDWPAVVSDQGCSECPAKSMCPIPVALRDHRGEINTVEQAAEAAEKLDREAAEHRARREELKRFARAHGVSIRFGADQVLEFGSQVADRIADKEALWDAVDRAVRYGEAFDRARHVKTVTSTPFRQRTLSEDELAEEAAEAVMTVEGSDG